jgi:hypothetical protein
LTFPVYQFTILPVIDWEKNMKITAHEAAHTILLEEGRPLSSRELAKRMLDRNMVSSVSRDPVFSFASTIEKNIRDGIYNHPPLVFVNGPGGRLVGLPNWNGGPQHTRGTSSPDRPAVPVLLPADLVDQLQLATQARLAASLGETTAYLLRKGLAASASEIKTGLLKQLESLDRTA